MLSETIRTRRADARDAEAIAAAHLDSIRSIGPAFYPSEVVDVWSAGLTPDLYVQAMAAGEVFFIIQASLAGVAFYKANGFTELGRGDALLLSGHSMPCVFMGKSIR
jgi:hypothetical protein